MKLQQKNLFSRRWQTISQPPQAEVALQIQLVQILKWALKPTVLFYHVPNGAWLHDGRQGAKLRAMGILPGAPDLIFNWIELDAFGRKCRRVLHLELKARNGRLSDAQASFALAAKLLDDEYHCVCSIDEALAILEAHGLMRSDVKIGRLA
jgi:hypothetical protein